MGKKINSDIILAIAFTLVLAMPMCISAFQPDKRISHNEKRLLNVWPKYGEGLSIAAYFNGVSDYVKDHFAFRDGLIRMHNRLKLNLGESPTDNTVIGKDGWLFYKTSDPLMSLALNQNDVQTLIIERKDYVLGLGNTLSKMGVEYRFLVAPNKMNIYQEYLPSRYQMTKVDATYQEFINLLGAEFEGSFIDAHNMLLKSKSAGLNANLYFKHDTHWNLLGAHQVAIGVVQELRASFPTIKFDLPNHEFEMKTKLGGDLATYIGLKKELKHPEPFTVLPRCARRSHIIEIRPGLVKSQCEANAIRVLMVGDSFMSAIAPFIAESVGSLYMVKQGTPYNEFIGIARELKPDIVIEELVERHLTKSIH